MAVAVGTGVAICCSAAGDGVGGNVAVAVEFDPQPALTSPMVASTAISTTDIESSTFSTR
jgi:hypothetical protein